LPAASIQCHQDGIDRLLNMCVDVCAHDLPCRRRLFDLPPFPLSCASGLNLCARSPNVKSPRGALQREPLPPSPLSLLVKGGQDRYVSPWPGTGNREEEVAS
jgi:hypothetical protein